MVAGLAYANWLCADIFKGWTWDMGTLFGWDAVKSYCAIALPNAAGIVMEEVAFDAIIMMV